MLSRPLHHALRRGVRAMADAATTPERFTLAKAKASWNTVSGAAKNHIELVGLAGTAITVTVLAVSTAYSHEAKTKEVQTNLEKAVKDLEKANTALKGAQDVAVKELEKANTALKAAQDVAVKELEKANTALKAAQENGDLKVKLEVERRLHDWAFHSDYEPLRKKLGREAAAVEAPAAVELPAAAKAQPAAPNGSSPSSSSEQGPSGARS